jgi:antitoxin ChpS
MEARVLTTILQEVDGAVVLAFPAAVSELLDLKPGMVVALSVDEGRLVVQTQNRSKYTLQELLDQCDFSLPVTTEEREWLDAPAVGEEVL